MEMWYFWEKCSSLIKREMAISVRVSGRNTVTQLVKFGKCLIKGIGKYGCGIENHRANAESQSWLRKLLPTTMRKRVEKKITEKLIPALLNL